MLWVLLVYLFLYRAGRGLAAFFSGGMTAGERFTLLSPGAFSSGLSQYSDAQLSLISIAGMGLPLIVWFIWMVFSPRQGGTPLEAMKLVTSGAILVTLMPWVVIPLAFKDSQTMVSEDVSLFLVSSGIDARLAAGMFFVVGLAVYALARARITDSAALRNLLLGAAEDIGWQEQRSFYLASGSIALFILLAGWLFGAPTGERDQTGGPPPGYQFVREFRLAGRDVTDMAVAHFSRNSPRRVNVFLELRDVSAEQIELRLTGPFDTDVPVMQASDYNQPYQTLEVSQELVYGQYRLVLNATQPYGRIKVYIKWD